MHTKNILQFSKKMRIVSSQWQNYLTTTQPKYGSLIGSSPKYSGSMNIRTGIYDYDASNGATITGTAIVEMQPGQKVSDSLLFYVAWN